MQRRCKPGKLPSYRFHALFREILWEMAPDELGIEALATLKQQAAQLLIEQGQLDAAVERWSSWRP